MGLGLRVYDSDVGIRVNIDCTGFVSGVLSDF